VESLILLALPVLLLVLMFSSQRKRQRQAQQLQSSLQPGQQVVTTSGLFGRVRGVDDGIVLLEVAPGLRLRWDQRAIASVVPEGGRGWAADGGTPTQDVAPSARADAVPPAVPPPAPAAPARPADED
jgi:preprotein translocase subunit YajC